MENLDQPESDAYAPGSQKGLQRMAEGAQAWRNTVDF